MRHIAKDQRNKLSNWKSKFIYNHPNGTLREISITGINKLGEKSTYQFTTRAGRIIACCRQDLIFKRKGSEYSLSVDLGNKDLCFMLTKNSGKNTITLLSEISNLPTIN